MKEHERKKNDMNCGKKPSRGKIINLKLAEREAFFPGIFCEGELTVNDRPHIS